MEEEYTRENMLTAVSLSSAGIPLHPSRVLLLAQAALDLQEENEFLISQLLEVKLRVGELESYFSIISEGNYNMNSILHIAREALKNKAAE